MRYITINNECCSGKQSGWIKGKVYPRSDHEGAEGEYRYSSALSLTSALDCVGGYLRCSTRYTIQARWYLTNRSTSVLWQRNIGNEVLLVII